MSSSKQYTKDQIQVNEKCSKLTQAQERKGVYKGAKLREEERAARLKRPTEKRAAFAPHIVRGDA